MIYKSLVTGGGQAPQRRVDGVALLKGLPTYLLCGVALHELGHAWLFLSGVDGLDLSVEEGFCNELSWLYHASGDGDEAKVAMGLIELNPDRVYGDGFRRVHAAVQRYSLPTIRDYLRRYRQLPR
jgi:hypothetical protein